MTWDPVPKYRTGSASRSTWAGAALPITMLATMVVVPILTGSWAGSLILLAWAVPWSVVLLVRVRDFAEFRRIDPGAFVFTMRARREFAGRLAEAFPGSQLGSAASGLMAGITMVADNDGISIWDNRPAVLKGTIPWNVIEGVALTPRGSASLGWHPLSDPQLSIRTASGLIAITLFGANMSVLPGYPQSFTTARVADELDMMLEARSPLSNPPGALLSPPDPTAQRARLARQVKWIAVSVGLIVIGFLLSSHSTDLDSTGAPSIQPATAPTTSTPTPPKPTVSFTLKAGVPVARLCLRGVIHGSSISRALFDDDPSKGYIPFWEATGRASIHGEQEFTLGTPLTGESVLVGAETSNDYVHGTYLVQFLLPGDSVGHASLRANFAGGKLVEGKWIDFRGQPEAEPCAAVG